MEPDDELDRDVDGHAITVDGADITEHVAAMFDALVGSLDWGSGFLDAETIESILIVAELAGFDVTSKDVRPSDLILPWEGGRPGESSESCRARYEEHKRAQAEAIAAWRAQVKAKAQAMRNEGGQ